MFAHMRRLPPSHTAAPSILGPQLGWHHFTNRASYPYPQDAAQKAILKGAVHHQFLRAANGGMNLGASTSDTSSTPLGSMTGIGNLDNLVNDCDSSLMRRAGGKVWLVAYPCPWWMSGATSFAESQTLPVLPQYHAAYATHCANLANRYAGKIDGIVPWSEHKGYGAFSTLGRWNYEDYTALHIAAYDAVAAAQPGMYFGGPYASMRIARSDNGAATQGISKLTNAALEPGGVSTFVGRDSVCGIYGWYVDAKSLDLANYYIANAKNSDGTPKFTHFVMDGRTWPETSASAPQPSNAQMAPPAGVTLSSAGSIVLGSGTRVIDSEPLMSDTTDWIKARVPAGIKTVWVESYWGDGANNPNHTLLFQKVLARTKAAGLDILVGWGETAPQLVDYLFDSSGVITTTGSAYQAHTASLG